MSIYTLTTLYDRMFTGELHRLSLYADESFTFTIETGGSVVFENTYTPSLSGRVTIYFLDKILEQHIPELCADFSLKADGVELHEGGVKVFHCDANINVGAEVFLDAFFLTMMQGIRITHPSRHETLSVYCKEQEPVTVKCYYYDGTAQLKTKDVSLGTASGQRLLNVSSARFVDDSKGELARYVVMCGERKATYNVALSVPELSEAFIFRNSFNAWEVLYLTGTRTVEPQYTRHQAQVGGFLRSYQVDEVISLDTYTGPLPHGMEEVTMSLAKSRAVFFLLENGDAGEEAVITDCDLKHNNNGTTPSDLTLVYRNASVSYRMADDRTARMRVKRPPHIFDETFDQTYE